MLDACLGKNPYFYMKSLASIGLSRVLLISYRSEDFQSGIFGPCAWWSRALARLGELLERRRRRRRHLEAQVDILAGKLYLEFSNWILTHMRDIGSLIPGFYTEIRAGLI